VPLYSLSKINHGHRGQVGQTSVILSLEVRSENFSFISCFCSSVSSGIFTHLPHLPSGRLNRIFDLSSDTLCSSVHVSPLSHLIGGGISGYIKASKSSSVIVSHGSHCIGGGMSGSISSISSSFVGVCPFFPSRGGVGRFSTNCILPTSSSHGSCISKNSLASRFDSIPSSHSLAINTSSMYVPCGSSFRLSGSRSVTVQGSLS
jgi:hypothetical protein